MLPFRPRPKHILHTLLLFPIVFIIFYLDTIVLPVSPDLFWKTPLILVLLLINIIFPMNKRKSFPLFFWFGIFFAIKQIIIIPPESLNYYVKAASMGALDLFIPVLTLFFLKFVSYRQLGKVLFMISSSIIFVTIPYHLGIIENELFLLQGASNADLSKYGGEGNLFTGPFLNIHDAAITLSFALVGISYFFNKTNNIIIKFWILGLLIIGLMGIYLTYVRTALLMLLIAFIVFYFVGRNFKTVLLRGIPFLIILGVVGLILYSSSEVLRMRIHGTNVYGETGLSVGSGRLIFWTVMLEASFNSGILQMLLGIGREASMDYMNQKIGLRLFAHSGFIDILVSTGVLGFSIYLLFIKQLFRRINFRKNITLLSFRYVLVVLVMLFTAMIFQSHQFFWVFPIISIFVVLLEKEYLWRVKAASL